MADSMQLNPDFVMNIESRVMSNLEMLDVNVPGNPDSPFTAKSSKPTNLYFVPETESDSDGPSSHYKLKVKGKGKKLKSPETRTQASLLGRRRTSGTNILSSMTHMDSVSGSQSGAGQSQCLATETPAASMGGHRRPKARGSKPGIVVGISDSESDSTVTKSILAFGEKSLPDSRKRQKASAVRLLMPLSDDSSDINEEEFEAFIHEQPGSTTDDVTQTGSNSRSRTSFATSLSPDSSKATVTSKKKRKDDDKETSRCKRKKAVAPPPVACTSLSTQPEAARSGPPVTSSLCSNNLVNKPSTSYTSSRHLAYDCPQPLQRRLTGLHAPCSAPHLSPRLPCRSAASKRLRAQLASTVVASPSEGHSSGGDNDNDDDIIIIDSISPTSQQLAADEVLARRLQEEADRECAAHIAARPSPMAQSNPRRPRADPHDTSRPRSNAMANGGSSSRVGEREMLTRIGQMSDYDWALHEAVYHGNTLPPQPTGDAREFQDIIDQAVLDFMHQRHDLTTLRAAPSASSVPPHDGSENSLEAHVRMLSRIGELSDYEWSVHQATHLGRDVSNQEDSVWRNTSDILDSEIIEYLNSTSERRADRHREIDTRRTRRHATSARAAGRTDDLGSLLGLHGEGPITRAGMGRRGRGSRRGRRGRADPLMSLHDALNISHGGGDHYEQLLELLGDGNAVQGLTSHQLSLLPTTTYKHAPDPASNGHSQSESSGPKHGSTECNICFCAYEEEEELKILTCFHVFHSECIDKWLKSNPTCPICRVQQELGN